MRNYNRSIGRSSAGHVILRLALGLFLLAYGIVTVKTDGVFAAAGNEVFDAARSILQGDAANAVIFIIGVCAIIAGAGVLFSFFVPPGVIASIFYAIVFIIWIVVIVIVDILGSGGLFNGALLTFNTFLSFIQRISLHLIVLGAMLVSRPI